VSGIGFLGAGVILRDGIHVRGINTAATIWCSAAVGVLAGAGYLPAAATATALILVAHLALRPIAQRIGRLPAAPDSEVETTHQFRAVTRTADEAHIRTLLVRELTGDDFVLHSVQSHDLDGGSGLVEVTAELQRHGRDDVALEAAVSRLSLEPAVSSVTWTTTEPEPALLAAAKELAAARCRPGLARFRLRQRPASHVCWLAGRFERGSPRTTIAPLSPGPSTQQACGFRRPRRPAGAGPMSRITTECSAAVAASVALRTPGRAMSRRCRPLNARRDDADLPT
jgi:uncharacterized membrane protein YhiD involved in acid resistance